MGVRRRAGTLVAAGMTIVAIGVSGCASSSSGGSGGRQDRLTEEQIMSVEATNLYDIVERLRPQWLRVRVGAINGGRRILVMRGGTVLGDVQVLRTIGPEGVLELRYRDGADARLVGSGDGFVEAVIEISRFN